MGGVSSKPLTMTIGNFDMELANGDDAKRHICYFPSMKGSKAQQNDDTFRHQKRKLYHRTWEVAMRSIQKAQMAGQNYECALM